MQAVHCCYFSVRSRSNDRSPTALVFLSQEGHIYFFRVGDITAHSCADLKNLVESGKYIMQKWGQLPERQTRRREKTACILSGADL